MRKAAIALRWLLTGALLYGVYAETGPWTTVALFLGVLALEALLYGYQSLERRYGGG